MRLSRTDLLPVLAIIAGGSVGVVASDALLSPPPADYLAVEVLSATPPASQIVAQSLEQVLEQITEQIAEQVATQIETQTGTLAGMVRTGSGTRGLSKVQIFVEGTGRGGLSNDDGQILIHGVPPGERTVVAELIGYGSVRQTVTFVAGETAALNVRLDDTAIPVRGVVATFERTGSQTAMRRSGSSTVRNQPLIFVDGVRTPREEFQGMDSKAIARVEMYSGDEAIARYGGEASVGVIEISLKHEASESTGPDPFGQPVFTPFTVSPTISNEEEVQRALMDAYPEQLRAYGIGGTVGVYFFIDEEGRVRDSQVNRSSGHRALDDAAVAVADVYRFTPALNRDQPRPVWVSFPVTFQVR